MVSYLLGSLVVTRYEAPHEYWDGGGCVVAAPAWRHSAVPPSTQTSHLALDKLLGITGTFIL